MGVPDANLAGGGGAEWASVAHGNYYIAAGTYAVSQLVLADASVTSQLLCPGNNGSVSSS